MSSRKRSSWVPINQGDGDDPSANRNYYDVVEGVEDGWFTETEAMWPGQKFALALEVCVVLYCWVAVCAYV